MLSIMGHHSHSQQVVMCVLQFHAWCYYPGKQDKQRGVLQTPEAVLITSDSSQVRGDEDMYFWHVTHRVN